MAIDSAKTRKNGNDMKLSQKLGVVSLIAGSQQSDFSDSSLVNKLFHDLEERVGQAAQGAMIDLEAEKYSRNGYRRFIVQSAGLTIAESVTVASKKVQGVQGHYLFYVHTDNMFQNRGLAGQLLDGFRDFLDQGGDIGLLDNIIPPGDPAADMYRKRGWKNLTAIVGESAIARIVGQINCERKNLGQAEIELAEPMVYIPAKLKKAAGELKRPLQEIFFQLQSKQDIITMRQNEIWVAQTIAEFRQILDALLGFFEEEIERRVTTPLMRYLFTRFATKLSGFKRNIAKLIGYTGGDSIGQIMIPPEILLLPIQSYEPPEMKNKKIEIDGDWQIWMELPRSIQEFPARGIEDLPNYYRPSLAVWLEERRQKPEAPLLIGDILNLGFDPTRLKEIPIKNEPYIFERLRLSALPELKETNAFMENLASRLAGAKANEAFIRFNPPVLVVKDGGNAYVLRRKVGAVHYDEAVNLLRGQKDRIFGSIEEKIRETVKAVRKLAAGYDPEKEKLLTYFVPWHLEANQPKVMVDWGGSCLEEIIIA